MTQTSFALPGLGGLEDLPPPPQLMRLTAERWAPRGHDAAREAARRRVAECPFQQEYAARMARGGVPTAEEEEAECAWLDYHFAHDADLLDPETLIEAYHECYADSVYDGPFASREADTTTLRLKVSPGGGRFFEHTEGDPETFRGPAEDADDFKWAGPDPDQLNSAAPFGDKTMKILAGPRGDRFVRLTDATTIEAHGWGEWDEATWAATCVPDPANPLHAAHLAAHAARFPGAPAPALVPRFHTLPPSDKPPMRAVYHNRWPYDAVVIAGGTRALREQCARILGDAWCRIFDSSYRAYLRGCPAAARAAAVANRAACDAVRAARAAALCASVLGPSAEKAAGPTKTIWAAPVPTGSAAYALAQDGPEGEVRHVELHLPKITGPPGARPNVVVRDAGGGGPARGYHVPDLPAFPAAAAAAQPKTATTTTKKRRRRGRRGGRHRRQPQQ